MRRTPLKKKAAKPKRGAKEQRARRRAKKQTEWQRAYGSKARVAFVRSLPCRVPTCIRTPSENAHAETGGTGRKADADKILPLCRVHHRELHQHGAETFEAKHHLSLRACAEWTNWKCEQAGDFPDLDF